MICRNGIGYGVRSSRSALYDSRVTATSICWLKNVKEAKREEKKQRKKKEMKEEARIAFTHTHTLSLPLLTFLIDSIASCLSYRFQSITLKIEM